MNTVTWLHISDLHFRATDSHTWDRDIVLKTLLVDVAERIQQDGLYPDFIVVTGDIAYSGREEEYLAARKFLDELLRVAGLSKNSLFLVPGNHDVDRNLISPDARVIGNDLQSREAANNLLGDDVHRRLMLARFKWYEDFINTYLDGHLQFNGDHYFHVRILSLPCRRIAILGLNSAWVCASDEDETRGLLLGERQVRTALDLARDADLRIALLHHPPGLLRQFDKSDAEPLLCAQCDFILHGHMHQTSLLQVRTPDSEATIIAAGACYDTRRYPNSYNFVQLDPASGNCTVRLRRYSDEQGGFWARDNLTYRNVPNGTHTFYQGRRSGSSLSLGAPFQTPPLPAHFVPRPDVSGPLKQQLMADGGPSTGILVISAIHGLGGIGKSALGAALAHDGDIQSRFHEGVLWATLGQEPDLLSLLCSWLQALHDHTSRPTTLEEATARLRTLLKDKAVLMVVDDIWKARHLVPFRAGGARCRLLITTRRADIAEEVGAFLHEVDVMTPAQSLDLLSARLERPLRGEEREHALSVAEGVGYLPLALELAAARAAQGTPWAALRLDLEKEVGRLETLEAPRQRRQGRTRLEACFRLSLDDLRREDGDAWQAFVQLGVLPEDVTIGARMAATLWDLEVSEAADLLELLWNDALLLKGPPLELADRKWPGYRLHDLLHDLARRLMTTERPEGLGLALREAHGALLERYRRTLQEGPWHTLTDDGYIHRHLTWHMEQAGHAEAVHTLMSTETEDERNAWHQARDRLGQAAGYLADVARAWKLGDEEFLESGSATAMGKGVRYGLITASLGSFARRVGATLLPHLVKHGIWTREQGLAYARRIPDPHQRAVALCELAPSMPPSVQEEALAALFQMEESKSKAELLDWLVPRLSAEVQHRLLQEMNSITEPENRGRWLGWLAVHVPEPLNQTALEAALKAGQEWEKQADVVSDLSSMLPHLSGDLRQQAMEAALASLRRIESVNEWAKALTELVPHLSGEAKAGLIDEALAASERMEAADERANLLAKLIPHAPPEVCRHLGEKALAAARRIDDQVRALHLLGQVAPHLPRNLLEPELHRALAAVRTIENHEDRAKGLSALAPCLPLEAVKSALEVANELKRDDNTRMTGSDPRSEALAALVQRLAEVGDLQHVPGLLEIITARISRFFFPHDRAKALAGLIPILAKAGHPQKALEITHSIKDCMRHLSTTTNLIPQLIETGDFQLTLQVAWDLPETDSSGSICQIHALAQVIPHLPHVQRHEVLGRALKAIRVLPDYGPTANPQVDALAELAPLLPQELLEEALAMANELPEHSCYQLFSPHHETRFEERNLRAKALVALVPYLPEALREEVLREALMAAQSLEREGIWTLAMLELIPHLSSELLQEALTAHKIGDAWAQAQTLIRFLENIPDGHRVRVSGHVLHAVGQLPTEDWMKRNPRALALIDLTPFLPMQYMNEAWSLCRDLKEPSEWTSNDFRERVLTQLALRFAQLGQPHNALTVLRDVPEKLQSLWYATRARALKEIAPLLPTEGMEQALESVRAMKLDDQRSEALVALAPHLPSELHKSALALTKELPKECWSSGLFPHQRNPLVDAIVGLAPHLQSDLLPDIFLVLKGWVQSEDPSDVKYYVNALRQLVPRLLPSMVVEAYELTNEISLPEKRAEALVIVAQRLPPTLKKQALEDALASIRKIDSGYSRANLLVQIIPHLTPDSLGQMLEGMQDPSHADTLFAGISGSELSTLITALAPCLPPELLEKALVLVGEIESEWDREKTLLYLVPHLPAHLCEHALAVGIAMGTPKARAETLTGLAHWLPSASKARGVNEGLKAAHAIDDVWDRFMALTELIPVLSGDLRAPELLCEAFELVRGFQRGSIQSKALLAVLPHLPPELLEKGLEVGRGIEDTDERGKALAGLSPRLAELERPHLTRLWCETLHVLASRTRGDLLSDLRAMQPLIPLLGGPDAVMESFLAIQQVGRWWP